MNNRLFLEIILVSIGFMLFSCDTNKLRVDTSAINISRKVHRVDSAILQTPIEKMGELHLSMQQKAPKFWRAYLACGFGLSPEQPNCVKELQVYFNSPFVEACKDTLLRTFSDLSTTEKTLEKALKHLKYYYPSDTVPEVFATFNRFQEKVTLCDNQLMIGLENYLGEGHLFYDYLKLYRYLQKEYEIKYIVRDAMQALAYKYVKRDNKVENLMNTMIYNGKVLYFIDAMLPDVHDSIKMGYSAQQLAWCQAYEHKIWDYLVRKELLFVTAQRKIHALTSPAPFTRDFGNESPPRIASWVGWQIVRRYMEKNSGVTLPELMNNMNEQEILAKSEYQFITEE